MKKKNLFITLGLALGLGVGAAVGVGARQEVKEAEAVSSGDYIYGHAANATAFGAITKVHLWGSSGDYAAWDNDPSMTRIGSTNTYFLRLEKDPSTYAKSGIFRSASNQTGNLTVNASTNQVFHDFSAGSTSVSAATLGTWALATSENGWSTTTDKFTLSTSGTYSHRYYISYTFSGAGSFKLVNTTTNKWHGSHESHSGISGVTCPEDSGDDGANFSVSQSGTLVIWMTPTINAYGKADYIFDGTEGQMTFTADTYAFHYGSNSANLSLSGTSFTASGLSLTKGQSVYISKNGSAYPGFSINTYESNNLGSDSKIKATATGASVWITDGAIWVDGYKAPNDKLDDFSAKMVRYTISGGSCSNPATTTIVVDDTEYNSWVFFTDYFNSNDFGSSNRSAFATAVSNARYGTGLSYSSILDEAACRYATLMEKYPSLTPFSGVTPPSPNAAYVTINSQSENSSVVIATVIIAVTGAIAVGAYLLIKKKEN